MLFFRLGWLSLAWQQARQFSSSAEIGCLVRVDSDPRLDPHEITLLEAMCLEWKLASVSLLVERFGVDVSPTRASG